MVLILSDNEISFYLQYCCGQMLQTKKQEFNTSIVRSLDRLKIFSKSQNVSDVIPAFSYTAHHLLKYAESYGIENVNSSYFCQFKQQLEDLTKHDFSKIKKHERQIIDDILQTVNTELFLECLQPKTQRHPSFKLDSEGDINDQYIEASHYSQLFLFDSLSKKNILSSYDPVQTEGQNWGSMKMTAQKSQTAMDNLYKSPQQRQRVTETSENSNPPQNSEQLYEQIMLTYKQHRIDDAYKNKKEYQKLFPTQISSEQQQFFETIQLEYTTMIGFYKNFDEDGWKVDKIEKGLKLEYKVDADGSALAIKIESQFDISVENFLGILCEMELFGDYVPFCYDCKQLKVVSRNEKIGTSKIYIPCVTDRETYYYAVGYDRYNTNGSVFLYSKTINDDKFYQKKYGYEVPPKSDYVRLQYKFFIIEYIPVTKNTARVRLASKIEMKLNFLPQFIIHMSARKFAFDYFKNIIKVNKKFKGSKWQKKIRQNPQFYEFFTKKIEKYLGQK